MVIKRGFSLIELIVVIGLLSLLMLAISSTMLMSIVSSNRIRTTSKIKQAGNFAMGEIQGMLRSAKSITSCNSTTSTITFVNPDGGTTTINTALVDTTTSIASNSGVYLTPPTANVTSFTIGCEPSDSEPTLVNLSFDLKDSLTTRKTIENPLLHFETSISLRNE